MELKGPDLTQGVPLSSVGDGGMLSGHAHGEPVLLARRGETVFAIGAVCTHYGAPLDEGLLVEDTVRCPWHHACFSLRSGEALRAPALDPVSCWRVEQRDGMAYVRERLEPEGHPAPDGAPDAIVPDAIVIVGGGAAGNAAAEMLRREGYAGSITMLSADEDLPCDRPKLSKGFCAGAAPEESVPLRSLEFYREHRIELTLGARATAIDIAQRAVRLADGGTHRYGALLIATGAAPVRLGIPGGELPHVRYLRSFADSRALIAKAEAARRAVVIGASFIGLEVAASLRARDVAVEVVTPEACPMERVLGPETGRFIQALHERHGVTFHLQEEAVAIGLERVTLRSGASLDADLVVVGIGVRPEVSLAEQAGLATGNGVMVDEYMQTSGSGIFAAGDIANWPDRLTGERIRVEHWVVAERQGQTAALNMLGRKQRFDAAPFFWTIQYDFGLGYIGHAAEWDRLEIDGSIEDQDCAISYWQGGRRLAMAIIQRNLDGLHAEVAFETFMAAN